MAEFGGRNRLLPTDDAIEPIAVLAFAFIQMNLIQPDH
jgi:hypothetical protein